MNAKEISDATLESVTPADNDLMLIYDTSEGTTGKATIAGIAPKVAENIDIATLPAVTPAADDVLMLRDTSAGTTGKATIAGIAPKVAENIDISTLPAVTPAADDVLMLRDTSAGTTGKATIADIFNVMADFLEPLGTIKLCAVASGWDEHWHECDGTNGTLDLRECVPVGVGTNGTDSIEAHDIYTIGQFKDDQLQNHDHGSTHDATSPMFHHSDGNGAHFFKTMIPTGVQNARVGDTTHGKQKGVVFIQKITNYVN